MGQQRHQCVGLQEKRGKIQVNHGSFVFPILWVVRALQKAYFSTDNKSDNKFE